MIPKETIGLGQIKRKTTGQIIPIKVTQTEVHSLLSNSIHSTLDIIKRADEKSLNLTDFINGHCDNQRMQDITFQQLVDGTHSDYQLDLPVTPPEVWACGVTYKKQAVLHDEDLQTTNAIDDVLAGLYSYVHSAKRPEIFFKGTASRCSPHNGVLHVRNDSDNTMPEAELAFVVGNKKNIVGYTICNDMTAWDLERESPLYLSYCKVYSNSCGLGPLLIPAECIANPRNLDVEFSSYRDGKRIFHGKGTTSLMVRSLEELVFHLHDNNIIPPGTVLSTGTAIHLPHNYCAADGEINEITIQSIGMLRHSMKKLS